MCNFDTDIGTEELGHLEIVATVVHQLTKNLSMEGIEKYFQSQCANIYNPTSDFTGYNACYLYKGTVSTTRKQCDLSDKEIVLASHKGFIPSKTWLACRIRCLNNRQSAKTCKPKNSWLVGKVKFGIAVML